jgi:adenine phosphoribosyltransferase
VLRYKAILSFVNDIKVVAQADGILLDILVDEGTMVSKDTVMIQIDNRLANAEKEIATRELESARLKAEDDSQIKFSEASFDVSSSVFKRSQELYEKIAESLDDLEKKRLEKIKAGFQIDVSKREQKINEAAVGVNEAKLNASLVQLELRTIKAPFSGVVASVQKERFDWVKAGEEILRLVSLEKFRVKGTVRLMESPNLLEGARAKVIVPIGAGKVEEIQGVVGYVSPESQGTGARNDGTHEYAVWVEIPNKQVAGKYLFRGAMDLLVAGVVAGVIDKGVGIDARGFIFGAAAAARLDCGFVPVRKKGKLPWVTHEQSYDLEYGSATVAIHTDAVKEGERVLVLDDLLATGGTAAATLALLEKVGAKIVGMRFLIELAFLQGRERLGRHPIQSLITY